MKVRTMVNKMDYKMYTLKQIFSFIDATSLNDNDTQEIINNLCKKAHHNIYGNVAAVCIYPQFIQTARQYFATNKLNIKIATVTNFPHGNNNIANALAETKDALNLGADEVDIVFPYTALIDGDENVGAEMIAEAKKICGDKILKVIIESGELKTAELIKLASEISIKSGADFIKTSTGKVKINATLEATEIMLNSIKELNPNCGFKAAGGIRTVVDANKYLELAAHIMGDKWITPEHFRIGASALIDEIINKR